MTGTPFSYQDCVDILMWRKELGSACSYNRGHESVNAGLSRVSRNGVKTVWAEV